MSVLISANILTRTIRIRTPGGTGSAVVFGNIGPRVVVSAAHLLRGTQIGDRVGIRHLSEWGHATVGDIEFGQSDVCAFLPTTSWGEGLPPAILNAELMLGETVAFCGYPLGLEMQSTHEPAWPKPLVKAGVFSGAIPIDGRPQLLFDASNNVGFSGGPIVRKIPATEALAIVGIVSGYKYDAPQPVLVKDENGQETESPTHFVRPNSGFMYGVPASEISPLIITLEQRYLTARAPPTAQP